MTVEQTTTHIVHRPARSVHPEPGNDALTLAAPPQLTEAPTGIPMQALLPVVGSLSSIVMMTVLRNNPIMVVVGALILVVALVGGLGMALSSRGRQIRERRQARTRYLEYLDGLREDFNEQHRDLTVATNRVAPPPALLTGLVENPLRLWERRPKDADFLSLRIGTAPQVAFEVQLPEDQNPVQPFDPILVSEVERVIEIAQTVSGLPVAASLRPGRVVTIVAPPELAARGREVGRALVSGLIAQHAPEEAQLAAAIPESQRDAWAGIHLVPHLLQENWDGPLQQRRIAGDLPSLTRLMSGELQDRHVRAGKAARLGAKNVQQVPLVMLVESATEPEKFGMLTDGASLERLGLSIINIVTDRQHESDLTTTRITVLPPTTAIHNSSADRPRAYVEQLDVADSTAICDLDPCTPDMFAGLAAAVAPLKLSPASRRESGENPELDALDILEVADVAQVGHGTWGRKTGAAFLTTRIGADATGEPLELDIKEAAQGGMGPHGICIGATGSGKSEFLRTLVLGLAVSHGPEDLSMILVDYKGGAAFSPFEILPQVAGVIDNLEGEAGLIERAKASLSGEIVRRQQQLKNAGTLSSITEYRAERERNPGLPPMPHLLIVLDEFGELLTAEPDFIDLLLQIGRIGRSIGVHMLLSSQRIEGGRLRGLDTYLSYRIGLRTFSEQESHTVLGTPDAYHLPSAPGSGYLKVDSSVYTRFQSGYVSGPVPLASPVRSEATPEMPSTPFMLPEDNSIAAEFAHAFGAPGQTYEADAPALIDASVTRLRDTGAERTDPVWLPPLPDRAALMSLPKPDTDESESAPSAKAALTVPIGLVDDPSKQYQGTWMLDLDRAGGHLAIIGSPQSGRSNLLRTIAAGIATTLPPTTVGIYGLDLTGAGLVRIQGFPHVGGVATRGDTERQTRLVEELMMMLTAREQIFKEANIESLAHFRTLHSAGKFANDPRRSSVVSADIVVLIDGFGLVRSEFTHLETPLGQLLERGGSYGIHLVFSLTRWGELPMRQQPLVGNRIELRLNDPTESVIERKLSRTISQPGRALTDTKLFSHVALPTADDVPDEMIGEALQELAERTAASWSGPSAAPVRILPESVGVHELEGADAEPTLLPIGLRQDTMGLCLLAVGGSARTSSSYTDQHLLVFGDGASGKTNLLAVALDAIVQRRSADDLVIALMSTRDELTAHVPEEYLGGHARDGRMARELATSVAKELEERRQEGRDTPHVVVVVDDYDVLAAGGTQPLQPLLEYLPQGTDLGLSVWLTRPVAGASRALYDPAIQLLQELGATGVLLSGDRSEGQLWRGITPQEALPGRARLIRRGEAPRHIQIAQP